MAFHVPTDGLNLRFGKLRRAQTGLGIFGLDRGFFRRYWRGYSLQAQSGQAFLRVRSLPFLSVIFCQEACHESIDCLRWLSVF